MTECCVCGLPFAGTSAFDAHRVGVHEFTFHEGLRFDPIREDCRRCLRLDEFEAAGLALDDRGRWHLRTDAERARRRFSGSPECAPGVRAEATEGLGGTAKVAKA